MRARNQESAPLYGSVTAELTPLSANKVGVQFKTFKLFNAISINAPASARGARARPRPPAARPSPLLRRHLPSATLARALQLPFTPPPLPPSAQNLPPPLTGELAVTYLDEELRVSRGDKGNLFVLGMEDPEEKP